MLVAVRRLESSNQSEIVDQTRGLGLSRTLDGRYLGGQPCANEAGCEFPDMSSAASILKYYKALSTIQAATRLLLCEALGRVVLLLSDAASLCL